MATSTLSSFFISTEACVETITSVWYTTTADLAQANTREPGVFAARWEARRGSDVLAERREAIRRRCQTLGQPSSDDLSLGSPWHVEAWVSDGTLARGAVDSLSAAALAVPRTKRAAVTSGSVQRSVATAVRGGLHAASAFAERLRSRKRPQLVAKSLRTFRRRALLDHPNKDPGDTAAAGAVEELIAAKDALLKEAEVLADVAGVGDAGDGPPGGGAHVVEPLELNVAALCTFAGLSLSGGCSGDSEVAFGKFVRWTTLTERGAPPLVAALLFDAGAQPQAPCALARSRTASLARGMLVNGGRSNDARAPRVQFWIDADLDRFCVEGGAAERAATRALLRRQRVLTPRAVARLLGALPQPAWCVRPRVAWRPSMSQRDEGADAAPGTKPIGGGTRARAVVGAQAVIPAGAKLRTAANATTSGDDDAAFSSERTLLLWEFSARTTDDAEAAPAESAPAARAAPVMRARAPLGGAFSGGGVLAVLRCGADPPRSAAVKPLAFHASRPCGVVAGGCGGGGVPGSGMHCGCYDSAMAHVLFAHHASRPCGVDVSGGGGVSDSSAPGGCFESAMARVLPAPHDSPSGGVDVGGGGGVPDSSAPGGCFESAMARVLPARSEEHTSELQSR